MAAIEKVKIDEAFEDYVDFKSDVEFAERAIETAKEALKERQEALKAKTIEITETLENGDSFFLSDYGETYNVSKSKDGETIIKYIEVIEI